MKHSMVAFFVLLITASGWAAKRPNIVVFLSDDLGRESTSIHGSKDASTPTMDRLAKDGMVFNSAYVASPSCCPNRFSFLTGLMPARHGAHPNHSNVKAGTKFLPPLFKALGYRVLSFGKVAHGRKGFVGSDFNSPHPMGMSEEIKAYFTKNKVEEPVCLMVGDRRPHVLWTKDSAYEPDSLTLPPYFIDTPQTRQHWARYLTDISNMDAEMGRVYALANAKFGDNFVFLFTSDHGGQWPRGKWNLYDSGTRVPLIVVWPDHIKKGVRTNAMVSWVDLLPTLLDIAGGDVPKEIDGRSFASVLLGKSKTHRKQIFTTHTGDGVMNIFPMRSVRVGQYKYIHNLTPHAYHTNHSDRLRRDGGGAFWHSWDEAAKTNPKAAAIIKRYHTRSEFEFFDLEADPFELNNLANDPQHKERMDEMRRMLKKWTTQQGDDLKPHREVYLKSKPLPVLKTKPKHKKRGKKVTK